MYIWDYFRFIEMSNELILLCLSYRRDISNEQSRGLHMDEAGRLMRQAEHLIRELLR